MKTNKTKKPKKVINPAVNFISKDFHYYFRCSDYSYDTYRPCQEGSDCCDGNYCRCSKIENAEVKKVPESIFTQLADLDITEINKYGLERILTHFNYRSGDAWYIKVRNGYYGQEIDGIVLNEQERILKTYQKFEKLTFNKKVEYLLVLEYGYLLESLKDLNWKIIKVDKKDLSFGEHYEKLKPELFECYKDYPFIRGIVVNNYVFDGHHRLRACDGTVKVLSGGKL